LAFGLWALGFGLWPLAFGCQLNGIALRQLNKCSSCVLLSAKGADPYQPRASKRSARRPRYCMYTRVRAEGPPHNVLRS
jgi:hypothetical protein